MVTAEGEGGGQALDGVVVVVLFLVLVVVLEGVVAPLEGAAEGEVGGGVEFDGDGVVVGGEDGDLVGEAALDGGVSVVEDHDVGLFEPVADDAFDGVGLAAIVVGDLVGGEWGFAFVGDLVALFIDIDLDDVDFFTGKDHAFVGDEADAFGVGLVVGGEASEAGVVDDESGGCSAEEGGGSSEDGGVVAVEPGVSAEGGDHLVEELASSLGLLVRGLVGGGCAGDVVGLGEGVEGREEDQGEEEGGGLHRCSMLVRLLVGRRAGVEG